MKKKVLLIASMALVATLSVKSTLAYLESQTETVENTMEMGNVEIEQLQYERVVDEDGKWISIDKLDKYGYYPDELKEYSQDKSLFPAVFADGSIKWDDREFSSDAVMPYHLQSWGQIEGATGGNQLFDDSVKNVIDKFVFVENDGENDAYVRTWIAFEQGELTADRHDKVISTNINSSSWNWELVGTDIEMKDENENVNKYVVYCVTYLGADGDGILVPGKVSYPSLLQLYMNPEATNEDVKAIDGNGNGKFDILVLSQAVQTAGFSDAKTALDAAFGEATAENHPFNK